MFSIRNSTYDTENPILLTTILSLFSIINNFRRIMLSFPNVSSILISISVNWLNSFINKEILFFLPKDPPTARNFAAGHNTGRSNNTDLFENQILVRVVIPLLESPSAFHHNTCVRTILLLFRRCLPEWKPT